MPKNKARRNGAWRLDNLRKAKAAKLEKQGGVAVRRSQRESAKSGAG